MSFVYVAIASIVVSAGTAIYSNQQQKKAISEQKKTLEEAQIADEREAAAAEGDAAAAANAATADAKRRRRGNALALGDTSGGTLGGTSVLGAGSGVPVASKAARNALGAGAR
jgi:hypothetical protein